MHCFAETQPPRTLRAKNGRKGHALGNPQTAEFVKAPPRCLPLDPGNAPQAPPDPAIQRLQLAQLAETEVDGPPVKVGGHLLDHPLQGDASVSRRQFADPMFKPGHGLIGDATREIDVILEREAQE